MNSNKKCNYLFVCVFHKVIAASSWQSRGHLKSAKILLLPPKYEIIMVPSNHSNFQYCDIAFCKVITLNPLCFFFDGFLSKVIALKGDSDKITVTFR